MVCEAICEPEWTETHTYFVSSAFRTDWYFLGRLGSNWERTTVIQPNGIKTTSNRLDDHRIANILPYTDDG